MEKEKGWDKNDGTFLVLRRKTGLLRRLLPHYVPLRFHRARARPVGISVCALRIPRG